MILTHESFFNLNDQSFLLDKIFIKYFTSKFASLNFYLMKSNAKNNANELNIAISKLSSSIL